MTRYLVTGANGMLGRDLQRVLAGHEVTAASRAALDITDLDAVRNAASAHDVIINAAAYTRVDDAESHENDAYLTNAIGAQTLAIAASEVGSKLVQLSTDYVFNGRAESPYDEAEPRDPISAYGRTKAAGEELAAAAHPDGTYIVRTAWLYGANGPNFAKTMVALAENHETVSVVNDQLGQPSWTVDVATQIVALLDSGAPAGIYHATNSGQCTWFDFAQAIFHSAGLDPERVLPTDSTQFVRPAPRPSYSVLGHDNWDRIGVPPLRDWREALADAAREGLLDRP